MSRLQAIVSGPPGLAHGSIRSAERTSHPAVEALEAFARTASVDDLPELIARLEGLKARLYARLSTPNAGSATPRDRLLDVKEAAEKLCRSADWLYRHAWELPFVVRDGRLLRFSEQGIEGYIKRRMGN